VRASDSLGKVQLKLKNIKKDMKGWGTNLRGRYIKRKKEINRELEEVEKLEENQSLSATQIRRRDQIQHELLAIIDKEESYWQQRSRERWLLQGDINTSFFHRISNGCKRKRTIFSMKDGDNIIQGTAYLLNHDTAFYKNLFGRATDSGIRLNSQIWSNDERISTEEKDIMDRAFSEEEIKMLLIRWKIIRQLDLMASLLNSTRSVGISLRWI
jgi:Ser-tRNA(Ala) deacylase AlaX